MCGHGILIVKVTDSWLVGHEFKPIAAEDPPCRKCRFTLNLSRLKCPFVDMVGKLRKRERVVPLKCRPRHLNMAQNYEVRHQ
ncbi:hypothetical protein TNCV_1506861 [Trichonephila clavipes]|nr:hypothetical protein TNCV_1506861 [Trichonephila clavipes]